MWVWIEAAHGTYDSSPEIRYHKSVPCLELSDKKSIRENGIVSKAVGLRLLKLEAKYTMKRSD